jgi:predicted NUDIX family phosphoesterase
MSWDEKVLCVENKYMGGFDGFTDSFCKDTNRWINHCYKNSIFVDRRSAEGNPTVKQLIPYVTIHENGKIFSYKRAGSEKRLHDLYSIGLGGHINPCDFRSSFETTIRANIFRELLEELYLQVGSNILDFDYLGLRLRGVIYLDDGCGLVNSDHIGLLYELHDLSFEGMRAEGTDAIFRTKNELLNLSNGTLEDWSKVALNVL